MRPSGRLQRNPDLLRTLLDSSIFFFASRPQQAFHVPPAAVELLDRFARPATVEEALPDADDAMMEALSDWERRGLLLRTRRRIGPSPGVRSVDRLWTSRVRAVRARAARVRPARRELVDGLPLVVVDSFFTAGEVAEASKAFSEAAFFQVETADKRKIYPHDVLELFADVPFIECVGAVAAGIFPRARLSVYRAYCNRLRYGDVCLAHNDSHPPSLTTLYYANDRWPDEWGGETLFFGKTGDARLAVAPRPGRLVLFDGRLQHRGGPPSRVCNEGRLTVAVKYWLRGRGGAGASL
jgi:SM-20-related protein